MTIRIVIADDHAIFRQGLSALFSKESEILLMGEAASGDEAFDKILSEKPDVAVLDISMPGKSGIEITREVIHRKLGVRIIILSMHNDGLTVDKALEAGARGYILKDDAFEDLVSAIKTVHSGKYYLSNSIISDLMKFREAEKNKPSPLTPREKEVLFLITESLTSRQIAKKLFVSIKTIETHRSRIMNKLGLHKTAELVRYAMKEGIISS